MADIRSALKKNRLFRSLVYRFRAIKERHSYCDRKSTITVKGIRVNSRIQVHGQGNSVLVQPGAVLKKARVFILGDNNRIMIKENAFLECADIHIEDNDCIIEIGENTFIGPSHIACTENGRSVVIGKDCMLSSNISIRTGDSHSIIDSQRNRINPAQSVSIGDHCWIGEGAKIMKGVNLQKDTIVASGSIVTHSFSSNVILAGNPAKVVKEGVNWDSQRL